ncbi:MAG TPA: sialidase family protein, partial [Gemmataceae bacterium]|nr:sialidase family protein [Gemmataceae bacterium]
LAAAERVEAEPGRLLLFSTWFDRSDPARPLFDPATGGILRSRQLLAVSADEGDTWGPWQVLATPGLAGCATTGPVLRWQDGTIAYAFESFKEFDDPRPGRHGAWLLVSGDGGRTFGPPLLVARHPQDRLYYWDQRLCPAGPRGEFVALFWTHDLGAKRDRNVHLLRGSVHDAAGPRHQPRETTIPGQIAAPLLLGDGRLLAFVVDRDRPGTMKLWQSHDGGATWPAGESLTVHVHEERAQLSQGKENIDFAQYWEDMGRWSFGHPAARSLGGGRVLLAFYAGTPERMSIHWARVRV